MKEYSIIIFDKEGYPIDYINCWTDNLTEVKVNVEDWKISHHRFDISYKIV